MSFNEVVAICLLVHISDAVVPELLRHLAHTTWFLAAFNRLFFGWVSVGQDWMSGKESVVDPQTWEDKSLAFSVKLNVLRGLTRSAPLFDHVLLFV